MNTKRLLLWARNHLSSLLLTIFIILPALSFVLGSAALLVFIFWPTDLSRMTVPSIDHAAVNIVLLAHGLNDNPSSWSTTLKHSFEQRLSTQPEISQVIALDWYPYSASALRCSVDGKRIGAALGEQMLLSTQLQSVHLVGHSCGSYVIQGLCETLKGERSDIQVQSTYLAPVSIYGGIFWNYGNSHFGSCADFSDAYVDSGDTVGNNGPAPINTYGFDITPIRESTRIEVPPHIWPTLYYQELVRSGTYPNLNNNTHLSITLPPGSLESVKDLPISEMR